MTYHNIASMKINNIISCSSLINYVCNLQERKTPFAFLKNHSFHYSVHRLTHFYIFIFLGSILIKNRRGNTPILLLMYNVNVCKNFILLQKMLLVARD